MLQLFKSCQKGGTEIVQACNSCDFALELGSALGVELFDYIVDLFFFLMRVGNLQEPGWGGAKSGIHCLNCQLLFRVPFGCIILFFLSFLSLTISTK